MKKIPSLILDQNKNENAVRIKGSTITNMSSSSIPLNSQTVLFSSGWINDTPGSGGIGRGGRTLSFWTSPFISPYTYYADFQLNNLNYEKIKDNLETVFTYCETNSQEGEWIFGVSGPYTKDPGFLPDYGYRLYVYTVSTGQPMDMDYWINIHQYQKEQYIALNSCLPFIIQGKIFYNDNSKKISLSGLLINKISQQFYEEWKYLYYRCYVCGYFSYTNENPCPNCGTPGSLSVYIGTGSELFTYGTDDKKINGYKIDIIASQNEYSNQIMEIK